MKACQTFMTPLMAMAFVCIAQAETTVRITGSTAYRSNTHQAIRNIYDAGVTYCYSGTTFGGSTQAIFHGTISGKPVTIKTSWSGSERGIQTVSASLTVPFLVDSIQPPGCIPDDISVPDVAITDTFQSSSAFLGIYWGVNYPALTESPNSPVGIVPYKFLANRGAPASLGNITDKQAQLLWAAGTLPLSFFTGNSADENKTVVATGRDPGSGTRLTALAEIGLGSQASIKHWQPLDSNGNPVGTVGTPIEHFVPWPASVVNGIPVAIFNGGFSSGGDLSRAIANTTPTGFTLVSYAGTNDADANSLPSGAVELSYNGILLGNTGGDYNSATVLTEGKYTFWGYEHVYYRSDTPSMIKSVADAVALQLRSVDASVRLSSMKVQRRTDGSIVVPSFNVIPPP